MTRIGSILLAGLLLASALCAQVRVTLDAPDLVTVRHGGSLTADELDGLRIVGVHWNANGELDTLQLNPSLLNARAVDGMLELRFSMLSSQLFSLQSQYTLTLDDGRSWPVLPEGIYPDCDPDARLGCTLQGRRGEFRLYSPRASQVRVNLYASPDDPQPMRHLDAEPQPDGTWIARAKNLKGVSAWTWSQRAPLGVAEWSDLDQEFADPWSRAVATRNTYGHTGRTLLRVPKYHWKNGREKVKPREQWILYETHLRDLSADPSAGVASPGSYKGFLDPAGKGGLNHLKRLGITAVEFLPLQDFGNIELDYDSPETFIRNTWNSWERNHWGYMTSYFFAPESWYASESSHVRGEWSGVSGRQVSELKQVVDTLHGAGIAVVMDVVYNHVAQYDENCFKRLDPCYWFRLENNGDYAGTSGCGNDFRTERPLARRMILESLEHWIDEYRIDGFRFDLGAMIDDETLRQIHTLLASRDVFHTAEPWGGGEYEPQLFAKLDWAWWNDIYRVDLRGRSPQEAQGFIFGSLHPESSAERLSAGIQGSTTESDGFNSDPLQAVNYVESHDDNTLSDWVRIALGKADEHTVVDWDQRLEFMTLDEDELAIQTLAAFHLLTSAGLPMLHSGQELGRSKLVSPGPEAGETAGRIDHNSYEKDSPTNWIPWELADLNRVLLENTAALCRYRVAHPELATAPRRLLLPADGQTLAWVLEDGSIAVVLNSSPGDTLSLDLPARMDLRLSAGSVRLEGVGPLVLGPRSAAVLELRPAYGSGKK
ncbi:MAG: hypothetical protein H6678_07355 [Candidatus Delongbacteria bacterium]|nr:hypothetical protein [Candidatus Cloacimonadota bacterium]MCB9473610.1 hypothetical protein [Candidatus Delongbacteria bacterium]